MLPSDFSLPLASLPPPLSDLEIAFRDGAAQAYVSATAERFEVVIGMQAWRAAHGITTHYYQNLSIQTAAFPNVISISYMPVSGEKPASVQIAATP